MAIHHRDSTGGSCSYITYYCCGTGLGEGTGGIIGGGGGGKEGRAKKNNESVMEVMK